MSSPPQVQGVHLVGSINLPTTSDVFTQIPTLLPNRLRRLPDGETGDRYHWIRWQFPRFAAAPEILHPIARALLSIPDTGFPQSPTPDEIAASVAKLAGLETRYDDVALESYALFKQKQDEGVIPPHVKFQVCLPGLASVMCSIAAPYQRAVEPVYEAALVRSLRRIMAEIPHAALAVQVDAALEIAYIEGVDTIASYMDDSFAGSVDRLSRFAALVDADVDFGFHLCYGDNGHKHFIEPKDLALLVRLTNALCKRIPRPLTWVHMPVPKDRTDDAYYAPLAGLEGEVGELYLGVVHVDDEAGTRERMKAAGKVVRRFGVATECGMGRTPVEEFGSIMRILRDVSEPVV